MFSCRRKRGLCGEEKSLPTSRHYFVLYCSKPPPTWRLCLTYSLSEPAPELTSSGLRSYFLFPCVSISCLLEQVNIQNSNYLRIHRRSCIGLSAFMPLFSTRLDSFLLYFFAGLLANGKDPIITLRIMSSRTGQSVESFSAEHFGWQIRTYAI